MACESGTAQQPNWRWPPNLGWRLRKKSECHRLARCGRAGTNDHLRRIVLVSREGEPLAVTAWLADDDLEPARLALEELSGPGLP